MCALDKRQLGWKSVAGWSDESKFENIWFIGLSVGGLGRYTEYLHLPVTLCDGLELDFSQCCWRAC